MVGCDGVADHKSMHPCLYKELVDCPMDFAILRFVSLS